MKLIVKCPKCKHKNKAPHIADNRIDYAKMYGEQFTLTCNSCLIESDYHVDNIKAVNYSFGEIIANRTIIMIITPFLSLIVGFFIAGIKGSFILSIISSVIAFALIKSNNSSNNLNFNKHKLRGHVSKINFKR